MTRLEAELNDLVQRLRKRAAQSDAQARRSSGDAFVKAVTNLPVSTALTLMADELEVTLGRIRHG
ncbi:hypothetical protein [Neorhizobium galegae]|uniref:hypothetical protein n=1 Tax=Neorhizobium galegae TaxID=399 RepID=UPI000621BA9F|nr:hypothetical protein [Neorhizobium galegae]CDZ55067.1 Hypothetical protein NGAL_HAMBI2427_59760 [Neorhizobium galegae bv. orientalis]